MMQLKYNDDLTEVVKDIPHWKNEGDIPKKIVDFIVDTSDRRVIYERSTGKYYCAKCISRLDDDNYCGTCNTQHKRYTSNDIAIVHKDITNLDRLLMSDRNEVNTTCRYLSTSCKYFVFDIVDNDVYFYTIIEEVNYDNPFYLTINKSSKIYVDTKRSYLVEKDGLTRLDNKEFISYKELDYYLRIFESSENEEYVNENFNLLMEIYNEFKDVEEGYVYTDNLDELKETIYRYSYIWNIKQYLENINSLSISSLTLFPIYYPQFEYLIKYGLYNLALCSAMDFNKGKNFKEIFGVDKRYLSFMVENDITLDQLAIMRIYPTTDIDVLRFYDEWILIYKNEISELVEKYKVDLKILKDYLLSLDLSAHYFIDYLDYIKMAEELRLDFSNKNVLYPSNLREAHDNLFNQIELIENPEIDEKIIEIAQVLSLNNYEDDEYVIFPASSIADLVEESRQQKNCVRTYCERIANNECHIYFMRRKEEIDKSFVTIEVRNNEIVQARVKYNELPCEEISRILEKWEDNLVSVMIDN